MAIMKDTHEVVDHAYGTVCHTGNEASCRLYVNNSCMLFNIPRNRYTIQTYGMHKSRKNHPTSR